MNRYDMDEEDEGEGLDTETAEVPTAVDGLEIALPENADTYRLLMGEDPEENPKVQAFRDAYDESMAQGDGNHEKCMEVGRQALEGAGPEETGPSMKRKGMGMTMMGGENPLNMR